MTDINRYLPIENDRVRLRALADRDAEAYAAGTSDRAVRRFAHLPEPHYTPELVRKLVHTVVRQGLRDGELALLTIAAADSDAFRGSLVLFDITEQEAEVGFWLAPQARGHGLAREAIGLAVRLAARLGLRRLRATAAMENTASLRTLAGAGFTAVGEPDARSAPSGARVVAQCYELLVEPAEAS